MYYYEVIDRAQEQSACYHCDSVTPDGESIQVDEDGPLCQDCYRELCGERDRADERWQQGDIEFDRQRGN
jgi:hypothetical protein